jgi:hypothetical protein
MRGQFTWIFAGCAIATLALGCNEHENHVSCTQSLQSACQNGACDNWRKFDDVIADPPLNLSVATCGDRRVLTVSDFYLFSSHVYDARGRLIGAHGGSDQIDQHCQDGFSAGDTTAHDCDSCLLTGYADFSDEACTGKIAQPRIAMCMHDPPALVHDCAACACEHCYPQLLTCTQLEHDHQDDGELCQTLASACVSQHCGACMAEPADGDADAGH